MNTLLPPDFREFLNLLNAHRVEYLLVGGYALGYHGYPRATVDMDVWIAVNHVNAKKIETVFGSSDENRFISYNFQRLVKLVGRANTDQQEWFNRVISKLPEGSEKPALQKALEQ